MHADAGNLTRRKESWNDVAARVGEHLGLEIGWHATHGVVRRWLHRYRLTDRLDTLIDAREVGDVRQLLFDHLSSEMANVKMNEILAADAAALTHLLIDGARDHVAWCQLHQFWRIGLHETFSVVV